MKNVVITGAAGGLGKAVSEYMATRGIKVFALDINEEALSLIKNENIVPVKVNICDKSSILQAVDEVKKHTNSLDGIINFAGILYMGSLIEGEEVLMDRILKINLLGMYMINKYFFPLLVKGQSRIINVSSEIGWLSAQPFNGFYGASKYAVEAYNDSLRRELLFAGIKVIKVNPGSFKTEMHSNARQNFDKMLENTLMYKDVIRKMEPLMLGQLKHAKSPIILAAKVYKAFIAKKPKIQYKVNTSILLRIMSILPEKLQDIVYKTVFERIL